MSENYVEQIKAIDVDDFASRGQLIYQALKEKLEANYKGKIVAIDVDTGEYFLGETAIEAVNKGRQKYPHKIFYTMKIGFKAVHSHKRVVRSD